MRTWGAVAIAVAAIGVLVALAARSADAFRASPATEALQKSTAGVLLLRTASAPVGAFALHPFPARGTYVVAVDVRESAAALELIAAKLGARAVSFTTATVVATPGGEREVELVLVR